jgi:hypothetical protein
MLNDPGEFNQFHPFPPAPPKPQTGDADRRALAELQQLVSDCTAFDPDQRPTFVDILERIRRIHRIYDPTQSPMHPGGAAPGVAGAAGAPGLERRRTGGGSRGSNGGGGSRQGSRGGGGAAAEGEVGSGPAPASAHLACGDGDSRPADGAAEGAAAAAAARRAQLPRLGAASERRISAAGLVLRKTKSLVGAEGDDGAAAGETMIPALFPV